MLKEKKLRKNVLNMKNQDVLFYILILDNVICSKCNKRGHNANDCRSARDKNSRPGDSKSIYNFYFSGLS